MISWPQTCSRSLIVRYSVTDVLTVLPADDDTRKMASTCTFDRTCLIFNEKFIIIIIIIIGGGGGLNFINTNLERINLVDETRFNEY
jgi:hypothetical protein